MEAVVEGLGSPNGARLAPKQRVKVPVKNLLHGERSRGETWESFRKIAMVDYGFSLHEALLAVFALEFGLRPMQDPRKDCLFLDGLDGVCVGYDPEELEAAFYAAGS